MNWGKGIALTLFIFIAMIMTLVYMSTRQHFSLVSESYYEDSLDYDKVQLRKSNYTKLGEDAKLSIDELGMLSLNLPSAFTDGILTGKVHLYSPTDSRLDKVYVLDQPFLIPTGDLKKGKWDVIVDWEHAGKAYQFERSVFIN